MRAGTMVGQGVEHADNYPCLCDVCALIDASVRHVIVRASRSDDIDMVKPYINPLETACGYLCGDDAWGIAKRRFGTVTYCERRACPGAPHGSMGDVQAQQRPAFH